jgi:hypothetical protein
MEFPRILDRDWIDANQPLICSWSAFTLIWSIHHDIILLSRNAVYDVLLKHYTVASSNQEPILRAIEEHRHSIKLAVDGMIDDYTRYHIASRAHTPILLHDIAYEAAITVIVGLHDALAIHASAMRALSNILVTHLTQPSGQVGAHAVLQRPSVRRVHTAWL